MSIISFNSNIVRVSQEKKEAPWTLNTSNSGKLAEFERLFAKHGVSLKANGVDLEEIQADAVSVVVHKATQLGNNVLAEDTSLEIEGAEVGINVRWLLDHLPEFVGRKAVWKVLLAYQKDGLVYVYEGVVKGTIVAPRGDKGFGFDPVFLPDGESETLAQSKGDAVNARALAVDALFQGNPIGICSPIADWNGAWQGENK